MNWKVFICAVFLLGSAFFMGRTASAAPHSPPPDYQNAPKHSEVQRAPHRHRSNEAPRRYRRYRRQRSRVHRRFINTRFRPIASLRLMYFGNGDFVPVTNSFGISATLKVLQPFEIEVGASFVDISQSAFANVGYSWELFHARRQSGVGFEMRIAALTGYRYMRIDDDLGVDSFHAVTVSTSLEFNLWLSQHFGFQLQFTGGLGVVTHRTDVRLPIVYPEFRTAFGVIF